MSLPLGAGSLAFWDNRACQHFAASDYFPHVRVMERVTIAGDKPYFDASLNVHALTRAAANL